MAEFKVTQDLYSNHNPLSFDSAAQRELRRKHGVVLHWASRRYRDVRGMRGLRPVATDDPRIKDILACTTRDEYEIELNSEDGHVRSGDLTLCTIDAGLSDHRQNQRVLRSRQKMEAIGRGAALADELDKERGKSAVMDLVKVSRADMSVTRDGEGQVMSELPGEESSDSMTVSLKDVMGRGRRRSHGPRRRGR